MPTVGLKDLLNFVENPNGTLTRNVPFPQVPANPTSKDQHAYSKDVPLNPKNKTYVRLFLPTNVNKNDSGNKLPVIVYFHGGGFILYSASSSAFHETCMDMASHFPALVVSVEYRLAPEHRLPAAYEDAMEALQWVKNQANDPSSGDEWLRDLADFKRCFLMGMSAGGNIAWHACVRALEVDLEPLKIVGLILNMPYFSSVERTSSEAMLADNQILPLNISDQMWALSLPLGEDRDHEYCNPIPTFFRQKSIWRKMPRCFFRGYRGDPLIDKQEELAKMLVDCRVQVVTKIDDDGFHANEVFDPVKARTLVDYVKEFVCTT